MSGAVGGRAAEHARSHTPAAAAAAAARNNRLIDVPPGIVRGDDGEDVAPAQESRRARDVQFGTLSMRGVRVCLMTLTGSVTRTPVRPRPRPTRNAFRLSNQLVHARRTAAATPDHLPRRFFLV